MPYIEGKSVSMAKMTLLVFAAGLVETWASAHAFFLPVVTG